MGLFSRRNDAPVAPDQGNTATTGRGGLFNRREKPSVSTAGTGPNNTGVAASSPYAFINRRPTFGGWFKTVWVDLLTMVILGAVGLGIYEAPPAPTRNFPVFFQDGEVVFPTVAYPLRKNIIPIWLAAFLASTIPIVIILVMQIRVKSFWDANNAILGVLYSLICAAVFQVFIKWLIGGLRPHFLSVCNPQLPTANVGSTTGGVGFNYIMYDRSICTGDKDEIDDSLESMPSGHSTAAFAGFVFLFLYLNAKLKLWSNYHPAFWKMIVVYAPILGAALIAGSLTIDEFHHWYDVLAGATIGTFCAFGAYRMCYAAIWDWRFNHIPLPRGNNGVNFAAGQSMGGFENTVFTHKAGWGTFSEDRYGNGAGSGTGRHHHHHGHGTHRSRSRSVNNNTYTNNGNVAPGAAGNYAGHGNYARGTEAV